MAKILRKQINKQCFQYLCLRKVLLDFNTYHYQTDFNSKHYIGWQGRRDVDEMY